MEFYIDPVWVGALTTSLSFALASLIYIQSQLEKRKSQARLLSIIGDPVQIRYREGHIIPANATIAEGLLAMPARN
ncbi:hypothetical protein, partial [Brevibacterium luteolum]|uniref:hypothetical protein n=1 Tax=Brevibacterium luteolum TaxID=199591 RepID=UPI00223B11BE